MTKQSEIVQLTGYKNGGFVSTTTDWHIEFRKHREAHPGDRSWGRFERGERYGNHDEYDWLIVWRVWGQGSELGSYLVETKAGGQRIDVVITSNEDYLAFYRDFILPFRRSDRYLFGGF